MATKIYGASDDLIEFEGDLSGEVNNYGTDDDEDMGTLVALNDGTLLSWKYGKGGQGVWGVVVLMKGRLFQHVETCNDEEAEPHSDVVHLKDFKDGTLKAWAAKNCGAVR